MPKSVSARATAGLWFILAATAYAAEPAKDATRAPTLDAVDVCGQTRAGQGRSAAAASRLDLSARELPAAVSVLEQDALRQRFESTTVEALDLVPGVVGYYSFGTLNVSGRGFAGVFNSPVLYDGVRYPGWQIVPRSTLNYARIEVLKGPAALTAGQGSIAGAINLVPQRADRAAANGSYLGFGRYGTWTTALGWGGALAGSPLRARIDASYQASDQRGSYGYARDTSFVFRHLTADFVLPLGEAVKLGLSIDRFRDDAEGYFGSPLREGRLDPSLRDINYNVVDDRLDMDALWWRARIEWVGSESWSGRLLVFANDEERDWRNSEAYVLDALRNSVRRGDYLLIRHDQRLRGGLLESSWRGRMGERAWQVVLGVQADRNDHDRSNNSPFRFNDLVAVFPAERGVFRSLDPYGLRTRTDIEQRALYGEVALDLAPRWRLIGGLRHDQTEVDSFNALSQAQFTRRYVSNGQRLGLTYTVVDDGMAYASWSTSSEPPAQITTLGLANAAFDLTDGEQIELGFKQRFAAGEWSVALYDLRRTNILSRDPADPNRFVQVGAQRGRGVEVGATWSFGERFGLDAALAVVDAEFLRFDELVSGRLVSRRGNQPVNVPEQVGSLWLRYSVFDGLDLALGGRAVARRPANTANTLFLPGYGTLDVNLSWRTEYGTFGARLRNVFDRFYATSPYNAGNQANTGEPRWFEWVWQLRF